MIARNVLYYFQKSRIRLLYAAALICLLVIAYWLFNQNNFTSLLRSTADTALSLGLVGYLLFILIQFIVSMTGILPASLLAIIVGGLYGIIGGFFISFIGLLAAASCAFWMSRSLFRNWVVGYIGDRGILYNLDTDISNGGWKSVLLLRVSPVSPFGITSYALGLTRIRFMDYLLGTSASSFSLFLYVYSGNLIGRSILDEGAVVMVPQWVEWTFLLIGIVAVAIIGVYVNKLLRNK